MIAKGRVSTRLFAAIIAAALSLAVFAAISHTIWTQIRDLPIPFDTDEADHANAALELHAALAGGDFSWITEAVTRQSFYPPVHSIAVAASYRLGGVSVASSRVPSLLFYFLSGITVAYGVFRASSLLGLSPEAALLGAASALAWTAGSQIVAENAALCMLEACGVFFTALLLVLSVRGNRSPYMLAGVGFLLILTKYSFGIIGVPGMLLGIACSGRGRPEFERSVKTAMTIGAIIAVLCVCWLLCTDPGSVLHFFVGHPHYAPLLSAENLLFDLRSWSAEYSAHPSISFVIAIFAGIAVREARTLRAVRIGLGIVLCALIILGLSTTNEPRHFIIAAPALWLLGGIGSAIVSEWILKYSKFAGAGAFALTVVFVLAALMLDARLPGRIRNEMEGRPEYAELQASIFSAFDCSQPALFIGTSDQFGIEALRWRGAAECKTGYTRIRFDSYPYRDDKNRTALKRRRNLDKPYQDPLFPKEPIEAVLDSGYYRTVVLIRDVGARGVLPTLIKEIKMRLDRSRQIRFTAGGKEITVILL